MTDNEIFTPDFREVSFWIDDAREPGQTRAEPAPLPARADVVVIGGGLTGTAAACELARGGRDTVVLDAAEPGEGASSRNAGMLGWHSKHYFTELQEKVGIDEATRFYRELRQIYEITVKRIHDEKIDCGFRKCGRFLGALSPHHHARMMREYETRARVLGEEIDFVPASKQVEMGSTLYYGGVVVRENAALQPARYGRAMVTRARAAGARVFGHTPAAAIRRDDAGFEITTPRGVIRARDVVIATNGYTSDLTPGLVKRLIPINAFMVATEPMSENLARSILPNHRIYSDNRRRSNYMQLSPDRRRLLFGGQVGRDPKNLRAVGRRLHGDMMILFPELRGVRLSHVWTGRCAATIDLYPRTGVYDGMHYALGYCFSGNAMGPYLGIKAARRILGAADTETFFAREPFPTAPWYARNERLMRVLMSYYGWADRRPIPFEPRWTIG